MARLRICKETVRSSGVDPSEVFGVNATEQLFCWQVLLAGLLISEAPAISIPEPVKNKEGKRKKRVTQPDFLVINDKREGFSDEEVEEVYVEVTKGGVLKPSKLAQLRVAVAAGIENYVQLSGTDVQRLIDAEEIDKLRVLKEMLGFF
jgi:hypothetical protein